MTDDSLGKVERTVGAVAKIIEVTKDSPEAKQAASNLGKTAVTITSALNNCLLPIAAVNYGIEKAKIYFQERFANDLAEKTASIAEENLIEPKSSIAAPILQGIAFTHEEPNLKEMYLSLLASTMDSRQADLVHPAFVEIVKQLNAEEATYLHIIIGRKLLEIVELRSVVNDAQRGWLPLKSHIINYYNIIDESKIPLVLPLLELWVNNWIRLGLCEVNYEITLSGNSYQWVNQRPEYLAAVADNKDTGKTIEIKKGVLTMTDLGIRFGEAVGAK